MREMWAIRGLTAGYGERCVLEPLDLDLPLGSTTTVVGPGGSGKTTLLRALASTDRPGSMWVRGSATPPPKSTLLVPQRKPAGAVGDLLPQLETVQDNAIIMLDEPFVQLATDDHETLHRRIDELHRARAGTHPREVRTRPGRTVHRVVQDLGGQPASRRV